MIEFQLLQGILRMSRRFLCFRPADATPSVRVWLVGHSTTRPRSVGVATWARKATLQIREVRDELRGLRSLGHNKPALVMLAVIAGGFLLVIGIAAGLSSG